MALVLTVENETSLPNGAPTTMRVADGRTLDIGRGAHLDWTLPDPSRFISGKHCEIRFRDGGFWLYDVSTNGTFLNDSARRLQAPHRLIDGDRLTIGSYVIAVAVEAEAPVNDAAVVDFPGAGAEVPAAPEAVAPPLAAPSDETPVAADMAIAADVHALATEGEADPEPEPFGAPLDEAAPPTADVGHDLPPEPVEEGVVPAMPEAMALSPVPMPSVADVQAPLPAVASFAAATPEPLPEPVSAPLPEPVSPPPARQPENVASAIPEVLSAAGAPAQAAGIEEFLAHFAKGAGIPESLFARQNGLKVAEDMGALMRLVVENLTLLLAARFKAKRFARTSNQTMIQALDNNPLKFAPTPEDALRIMFGPRTSGYLDARRALEAAFKDLKAHQLKTFSAMQGAVNMLVEDLDPAEIDTALGTEKSMLDLLGARKARLWDLYLARWQAKTLRHEDGLTDAFMLYFAECYDRTDDKA